MDAIMYMFLAKSEFANLVRRRSDFFLTLYLTFSWNLRLEKLRIPVDQICFRLPPDIICSWLPYLKSQQEAVAPDDEIREANPAEVTLREQDRPPLPT